MEDDREKLANAYREKLASAYASTVLKLSGELASIDVRNLTRLYHKITKKEADKIQKDEDPADRFIRILEEKKDLSSTNVDGLLKNLEEVDLNKAAGILKSYKSRNTDLINQVIEGQKQEEQFDASTAPSSPAKSPPSQKGDGTDVKDKLFISCSSKFEEKAKELLGRIESVVGVGSCFVYLKDMPGDSLPKNIADAIEKADMLCMINQDYIESEPCEEEFLHAKTKKKQIILLHMEKGLQPYKKKKNGRNSSMQLATADQVYAQMYFDNSEEEFQKVIAKIKECLPGRDANASGGTLVAPGSPSTSGRRKRKSSHDGDASEVKVTKKE